MFVEPTHGAASWSLLLDGAACLAAAGSIACRVARKGADDEHDHDERSSRVDGGVGRPRRGARGGAPAVRQGWWRSGPHTTVETTKSLALTAPFLLRPELGACLERSFWKKGHFGAAAAAEQ